MARPDEITSEERHLECTDALSRQNAMSTTPESSASCHKKEPRYSGKRHSDPEPKTEAKKKSEKRFQPCGEAVAHYRPRFEPLRKLYISNERARRDELKDIYHLATDMHRELRIHSKNKHGHSPQEGCDRVIRQLTDWLDMCSSIVHAARRLPDQLWRRIFFIAVSEPPGMILYLTYRTGDPMQYEPWSFSRVCKRWRKIMLSSPELWTQFQINAQFYPPSLISAALSRSGDLPLDIHFMLPILDTSTNLRILGPVLKPLVAECHRWRYLNLCLPWWAMSLLNDIKGHLSLLEQFHLLVDKSDPPSDLDFSIFEDAPRLRLIALASRANPATSRFVFPWSQLEDVQQHNGTDIHTILTNCTSAKLCSNIFESNYKTTVMPPQVRHTHLRSLHLNEIHRLPYLELPNLEVLMVIQGKFRSIRPVDPGVIASFIRRSGCRLGHLALREVPLTHPRKLEELFRLIPDVVEFEFQFLDEPIDIMYLLKLLTAEESVLCPKLIKFGLDIQGWTFDQVFALQELIRSRLPTQSLVKDGHVANLLMVEAGTFPLRLHPEVKEVYNSFRKERVVFEPEFA